MAQQQAPLESDRSAKLILGLVSLILALGVLGWRSVLVFTDPTTAPQPTSEFASLVETITGPGTVRIGQSEPGGLLILIDGPTGELSLDETLRIEMLAARLYPNLLNPTIEQYPFATTGPSRPSAGALLELFTLATLSILAFVSVVFNLRRATPPAVSPHRSATALLDISQPTSSAQTTKVAGKPQPSLYNAPIPGPVSHTPHMQEIARMAQQNPKRAAAILETWLHPGEAQP